MAVHTELSEANIHKILKNYQLGELIKFTGIKEGIENTNYLLRTKKKNFIITIFEKRVDVKQIPFYFEVMTNSHSKGIHCPVPIEDKNGELVNKVKNKRTILIELIFLIESKKFFEARDLIKKNLKKDKSFLEIKKSIDNLLLIYKIKFIIFLPFYYLKKILNY